MSKPLLVWKKVSERERNSFEEIETNNTISLIQRNWSFDYFWFYKINYVDSEYKIAWKRSSDLSFKTGYIEANYQIRQSQQYDHDDAMKI